MPETKTVTIKPAKGRPMLTWAGKRPLRNVTAYPAQLVETFSPLSRISILNQRSGRIGPPPSRALAYSSTATTKTCWPICLLMACVARSN